MSKKKQPKRNLVTLVLDRSGSMVSCLDATISGFNEYIGTLKAGAQAAQTYFTLVLFDSQGIDTIYAALPLSEVPELTRDTFVPRGMTPLYDAIGKSIQITESQLQQEGFHDAQVILVTLTDGMENRSTEFTRESIFQLISTKKVLGWELVYLGANQDAFAVGHTLGYAQGSVANYAVDNSKAVFGATALATNAYNEADDKTAVRGRFWKNTDTRGFEK